MSSFEIFILVFKCLFIALLEALLLTMILGLWWPKAHELAHSLNIAVLVIVGLLFTGIPVGWVIYNFVSIHVELIQRLFEWL